ncbi:SDR family oxidoreductase [Streptomyces boninensis]|uniref:SDR family oxidoreductase n=1 Tax=Streptomyces boninensis TaxID=2039455 RepID=UPI003B213F7C
MPPAVEIPEFVIGLSPFGRPDARLVSAVCRAGGLGVLDLGAGDRVAREALAQLGRWVPGDFGVRIGGGCALGPDDVEELAPGGEPHTVIRGADATWPLGELGGYYRVLVEVTSRAEALQAVADGADGLIARGSECGGGPVAELSTFVLLQQLLAEPRLTLPVWAAGGIGEYTAAAAVLGGAAGVVLDVQLALLPESSLPERERALLEGMDGTETAVAGGVRLLRRRGRLPVQGVARAGGAPRDQHGGEGGTVDADRALPAGEDGFLAARFSSRWGDVAEAVRAVRTAVGEAVRGAASGEALRPASGMCAALGTRLPIAQGPMTRVSDQPRFARAVADEGGLPFLALALADGGQTRDLMTRTRAELEGRPWGVGILGFADERTRAAQLEVVRELKPTHAIIAGGRPAQAADLEQAGIRTFLHVPSARLLRQYLDAGARRFVFEGSECGGHVGPLASFPLWEAQLGVLEEYGAEDVEVLFAGGVHDARSAAMVAALAARVPGLSAGVLMGTAYLFTGEAVDCGAVQPLFQRQVLAAESTALLQTAPGHATRCVPSPFTSEFAARKQRLRSDAVPDRDAWEELERLNVGRLRLASKGVERINGGLPQPVAEERQLSDGMFMAGQVAVLRTKATSVRELHREVSTGAADYLRLRAAELVERVEGVRERPAAAAPLDVAVVGMACMFPGADGLDAYWAQVLAGDDAITEVPPERWDPAVHFGGERAEGDGTPSKWGGFLPPIPFDPLAYGIPPASLGSIEPVQLLALEAAKRALDDAGYGARPFDRARTSVVFGAEAGSDLANATTLRTVLPSYVDQVPEALAEQLPRLTEDSFPGMLANVISGRIANRLDLGGANYTVDAACASSLAAVDVACKELVAGTSDMVLCGGADLHNGINDYLLFASVGALSPTGRCRTFDASADGIALGEGVACVALKRLADAERDGDRVYAVIKGVGSASDGRAKGLTAPRPEGQQAALERAYAGAGVSPARVGLVEAHGTGTVVGDRTELAVLTEVFGAAGAEPGSCALGSVKSQIGHTKCAAGLAGLIKTAMALHTGVLPPTRQLSAPNPGWDASGSPFVFHTEARPWAAAAEERVAGVSAFGFGGTNFHVVLGAHAAGAPPAFGYAEWPAELFTFGAEADAEWLLSRLEDGGDSGRVRLRDWAATAARRAASRPGPVRIAVVATDVTGLAGQLRQALAGEQGRGVFLASADADVPTVAFLFPGQGSQRPGMAGDLLIAVPELQHHLQLGAAHAPALYPPAGFTAAAADAQRARLTDTRNAQPALGIAGLTAYELLGRAGVRPGLAGGHSYGELVALCAAGVFTPAELIALSERRARVILDAAGDDPGSMAAVSASADETELALKEAGLAERVVTANRNAPRQTIISGPSDAVASAVAALKAAGLGAKPLPVACAFHSPVVAGAEPAFAAELAEVPFREPEFPVFANRSAEPYPGDDPDAIRRGLAAQIGAPVRFAEQVEAMYAAGARVFIEAGPGAVLSGLVGKVLGDRPHLAVPVEPRAGSGLPGFLEALARLAVAGVEVRTGWLFQGRGAVAGADAESAAQRRAPGWTVDGQLVRDAAGEPLPGALRPARRIAWEGGGMTGGGGGGGAVEREAVVTEFLRGTREMVAAQREVVLSLLGGGGVPAAAPVPLPAAEAAVPASAAAGEPALMPAAAASEAPAEPAADAPDPAPLTEDGVLAAVLGIISERTGYPADMIEPDLDLEADLSIDSIKRTEIAGELAMRLSPDGDASALGDDELEELAKARTAGAITGWLAERLVPSGPGDSAEAAHTSAPSEAGAGIPGSGGVSASAASGRDNVRAVGVRSAEAEPGVHGDESGATPAQRDHTGPGHTGSRGAGGKASHQAAAQLLAAAPKRLVVEAAPIEGVPGVPDLAGRRFAVLGGGDFGADLVAALGRAGADAGAYDAAQLLGAEYGPLDGVFHLGALAGGEPVLPDAFAALQAALDHRLRWLVAACRTDDPAGAGLAGLMRSIAREYPRTGARLVRFTGFDLTPEALLRELPPVDDGLGETARPGTAAAQPAGAAPTLTTSDPLARPAEPVIDLTPDGRRTPLPIPAPLTSALGARGAGPAADGAAEAQAIGLTADSVVVLAGGARGITARFALALAQAARCRVELLGRTPLPAAPEHPDTEGAHDRPALIAALARRGSAQTGAQASARAGAQGTAPAPRLTPAQAAATADRILAQREIAATLRELRALGSPARYHACDLRDADAVRRTLKEIAAEHGRIDAVIGAAGVIEDRLVADKDPESFHRVYGTKTDSARHLLDAAAELAEGPLLAVLFGSIAAVYGNAGQADYAAANDALEQIGTNWAARTGHRALTVHWGPWAPVGAHAGMVTPELGRDYARRGVELIDPDEGVLALLRELAWGDPALTSVVYTASGW